jgi:hypothetical protein
VHRGRLPRLRRRESLRASAHSPSEAVFAHSRQSSFSGEPPPQSLSARHILDSHLLQSTAAFLSASKGSLANSGPHASVVKLMCRLHRSLGAGLAFSFDSLWAIGIRGAKSLLCHSPWDVRLPFQTFERPCITIISSEVNGTIIPRIEMFEGVLCETHLILRCMHSSA